MSLDFYPAKSGIFPSEYSDYVATIKADKVADDFSDMLSFNNATAAKLISLLNLPVDEDNYGEIAAADLYQRCHALLTGNSAVIEEFTADSLPDTTAESSSGARIINIGTNANTVAGLRRRLQQLQDLSLLTMQRHGSLSCLQIC